MKTFEMFVPGIARTSGSHVAFKGRITHAGKYTKAWMDKIGWFALQQYGERRILHTGMVHLEMHFYLPRPQGHFGTGSNEGLLKPSAPKEHTKKPDVTKLARAAEDALTNIVYKDDSQVTLVNAAKYYADGWQKPGVKIIVRMN